MGVTMHSHYNPQQGRFIEHAHLHSRPHHHVVVATSLGLREVSVASHENYSPHGLPENRDG